MNFSVPQLGAVLSRITGVRYRDGGSDRSIAEWRCHYNDQLVSDRRESDISIFATFVHSLLERAICRVYPHPCLPLQLWP